MHGWATAKGGGEQPGDVSHVHRSLNAGGEEKVKWGTNLHETETEKDVLTLSKLPKRYRISEKAVGLAPSVATWPIPFYKSLINISWLIISESLFSNICSIIKYIHLKQHCWQIVLGVGCQQLGILLLLCGILGIFLV